MTVRTMFTLCLHLLPTHVNINTLYVPTSQQLWPDIQFTDSIEIKKTFSLMTLPKEYKEYTLKLL